MVGARHARARAAQRIADGYDQQRIDELVAAAGWAIIEPARNRVLAELALPVAGLMSLKSFEEVREELVALRAAAKSLGVVLEEPFLQLAFLALPVIPHLKITDHGMVDVDRFEVMA